MQYKLNYNGEVAECCVCKSNIHKNFRATLVCPQNQCDVKSHMKCLAERFLNDENSENLILPIKGKCPGCRAEITWSDLITGLSKRSYGAEGTGESKRTKSTRSVRKAGRAKKRADSEISALNKGESEHQDDEGLL